MQGATKDTLVDGSCALSFQGIDHKDLKRILSKLQSPARERRPRKCRRLNPFDAGVARLSLSSKIVIIQFKGNNGIGDEGMKHLHMIPNSVTNLDLSECNLSCSGIKTLCKWMAHNNHIQVLDIRGNELNDEAAKAVGMMMGQNTCLQDLSMDPKSGQDSELVSWEAAVAVCTGLHRNPQNKLQRFRFCVEDFSDVDEYIWYLVFARLLPEESPLRILEIASRTSFATPFDTIFSLGRRIETVCGFMLSAAKRLENIHRIDACVIKYFKAEEIQYYLDLNKYRARQLIRKEKITDKVFFETMTRANVEGDLDVVYYLLQRRPHLCDLR